MLLPSSALAEEARRYSIQVGGSLALLYAPRMSLPME